MINEYCAKKYCCEDISLIENYQEAINDSKMWDCHHRLECVNGTYTSLTTLKENGLYWKQPAYELIFLTRSEHRALHNKDPFYRKNLSKARKGRKFSKEHRKHLSEAHKGKHRSEETKIKIGKSLKGKHHTEEAKIKMSEANKGRHYWNNGLICKFCKEQPGPDFVPGRLRIKSL